MKSLFRPLLPVICLLALAMGGCSSAYTGLTGATMYSDGLADVAITPVSGLKPVASGSYLGAMPADDIIHPKANVHYAVYGDSDSQSVKRHAHIIFAELTDKTRYVIMPETFAKPNELNLRTVKFDGRSWIEHTFYESRQGDWFTELWDINGYLTPQMWFGKRWTRKYDDAARVVVEYREPLPACAIVQDRTVAIILNNVTIDMPTPECRREVEAVLERADQAFSMRRPATISTSAPAPAEILTVKPDRDISLERYVGTAEYMPKKMADD